MKRLIYTLILILLFFYSSFGQEKREFKRVITFAPNITRTVFLLGAENKVVGVTDFCILSPDQNIKRCGGWMNPNFEVIRALEPDLVIFNGLNNRLKLFCEERNIPTLSLYMNDIASIRNSIMLLANILRVHENGERICEELDKELNVFKKTEIRGKPCKVFITIERQTPSLTSILTAGKGTFLDEVITLAGGVNIFSDIEIPYPQISKESLISRSPDIIIEIQPKPLTEEMKESLRSHWKILPSIPAVRNGKIHYISDPFALFAGPDILNLIRSVQKILEEK